MGIKGICEYHIQRAVHKITEQLVLMLESEKDRSCFISPNQKAITYIQIYPLVFKLGTAIFGDIESYSFSILLVMRIGSKISIFSGSI